MTNLTIDYVVKCKDRGLSCSEVATEFGCSISAVYTFCRRNGISLCKVKRGGKNIKDMTGQQIGSLVVLDRAGSQNRLATWNCQCVCGQVVVALGSDLRQGKIKTCGCRTGIKSRRNWQGHGDIPKSYWRALNQNAQQRNIDFDLTIECVNDLFLEQDRKCALSGDDISFSNNTASLDRIENEKGYLNGNVQWVHKDVNRMKQTYSVDYFIHLCKLIANKERCRNEVGVTKQSI